jgi:hypothetical protein
MTLGRPRGIGAQRLAGAGQHGLARLDERCIRWRAGRVDADAVGAGSGSRRETWQTLQALVAVFGAVRASSPRRSELPDAPRN